VLTVEDTGAAIPLTPATSEPVRPARLPQPRWLAAIQVVLTCGIPSQLFAAALVMV